MSEFPETRATLLLRIADPANVQAWQEFVAIYRPAIYRLARRRGLQDSDADDLSQRVFLTISQKISEWKPRSGDRSFRRWISVMARNLAINAITRGPIGTAIGGTSLVERLEQHPDRTGAADDLIDEYRRSLFRLASEQVRREFLEATWSAFWLTAVEGLSIRDAALRLGKSEGVIYAGRSRVLQRLKDKVQELANAEMEP